MVQPEQWTSVAQGFSGHTCCLFNLPVVLPLSSSFSSLFICSFFISCHISGSGAATGSIFVYSLPNLEILKSNPKGNAIFIKEYDSAPVNT